jgi:hypothetical protein
MLHQIAIVGRPFLPLAKAAGHILSHWLPTCRWWPRRTCPDLVLRRIKALNKSANHVYLKAYYLAQDIYHRSSLRMEADAAGLLGAPVPYLPLTPRNSKHL